MDENLEKQINDLLWNNKGIITVEFLALIRDPDNAELLSTMKSLGTSNAESVTLSYLGNNALSLKVDVDNTGVLMCFPERQEGSGYTELWVASAPLPAQVLLVNSTNRSTKPPSRDITQWVETVSLYEDEDAVIEDDAGKIVTCSGIRILVETDYYDLPLSFEILPAYLLGGFLLKPLTPHTRLVISTYDDAFCIEQIPYF